MTTKVHLLCITEFFHCLCFEFYICIDTFKNKHIQLTYMLPVTWQQCLVWCSQGAEWALRSIRQRGRKVAEHNWWLHTSRGDNDRRRAQKSTAAAMIFLFYQSLLLGVIYRGSTRYFAVELELTFMGHISGSTALRVVPFQLRSQWGAEMRLILSLTNAAINCA